MNIKANKYTIHGCLTVCAFVFLMYYGFVHVYPGYNDFTLIRWISNSWNNETDFVHGWAVPVLFVVFVRLAWPQMKTAPMQRNLWGLAAAVFGLLCYLVCMRTMQPRVAFVGLPFLLVGSVLYVCGWQVAKHLLFPCFFLYFAIPVPGLQQATNFLQLFVTKACYLSGKAMGMDVTLSGNEIYFDDAAKQNFNIAEGCSGIRSLMALVMIAAIYAYYTQKELWKKAFLFAMSLPLAMLGNYARVFTILVLADLGYGDFAAGIYHDWAGLLFFFPIALLGLFGIDKLLNWKKGRRKIKTRVIS